MFDESTSWYLLSPPIPHDSIPSSEEEVSEAEMPRDEGEIRALGESLISFRLSGSNEGCKANWLHMGVQGKYNTEGSVNRYNA